MRSPSHEPGTRRLQAADLRGDPTVRVDGGAAVRQGVRMGSREVGVEETTDGRAVTDDDAHTVGARR